jgi:hypothetical protein
MINDPTHMAVAHVYHTSDHGNVEIDGTYIDNWESAFAFLTWYNLDRLHVRAKPKTTTDFGIQYFQGLTDRLTSDDFQDLLCYLLGEDAKPTRINVRKWYRLRFGALPESFR